MKVDTELPGWILACGHDEATRAGLGPGYLSKLMGMSTCKERKMAQELLIYISVS